MTKYADNIRRIVGEPRPDGAAGPLEDVGGIPASKSTATQTISGGLAGGNTINESSDNKLLEGVDDNFGIDKIDRTADSNGSAQAADGKDNQSLTREPDSGKFSAEDLIDNNGDVPQLVVPSTVDDLGLKDKSGVLATVTGTDPYSGEGLEVHIDGLYRPVPATTWDDGTPKTAEWEDPNTPPTKDGFTPGTYWLANATTPQEIAWPFDMDGIGAGIVSQNLGAAGQTGGPGTVYGPNSFSNYYVFTLYTQISASQYDVIMFQSDSSGNRIGADFTAFNVTSADCTLSPPTDPNACPVNLLETAWPVNNIISLALNSAKFLYNSYDPDATVRFSGQSSSVVEIEMSGGRQARMEVAAGGGVILYEVDSLGGSPTGTVRYYNNQGQFSMFAPASNIEAFRPPLNP